MKTLYTVLVVVLVTGCALDAAPQASDARVTEENQVALLPGSHGGKSKQAEPQTDPDAGVLEGPTELPTPDAAVPQEQDAAEPMVTPDAEIKPEPSDCQAPEWQPLPVDCRQGFTCTPGVLGAFCQTTAIALTTACVHDWDCTPSNGAQSDETKCLAGACAAACVLPQCVPGDADRECCDPVPSSPSYPYAHGPFTQRCVAGVWDQCKAAMWTANP